MEQGDNQQILPPPLLSRLDRLDRLVWYLEERQSVSRRYLADDIPKPQIEPEEQRRQLSTVLKEVPSKGTVIDRVMLLENRVLQLTLEIEEASRFSSPVIPVGEHILMVRQNQDHSNAPSVEHHKEVIDHNQADGHLRNAVDKQERQMVQENQSEGEQFQLNDLTSAQKKSKKNKVSAFRRHGKFLGCILMRP